ncbi:MAG: type I-E CRISPR-associated protein Cas6/Cse3/CasE [Propionibacteriales bacterium]|nr:type I-E CRISPR-associated protein Cas6/Cse3/CasE [Propionibacteriales bacterium]
MYLTRFEVNVRRRESRRLLASPQRIHAAVLNSFASDRLDGGRILWRVDRGHHGRVELLITSPESPDLTALVEECGWPSTSSWQTADYSRFLARLSTGQAWRFRLAANPTRSLSQPDRQRSKRVPVIGHHQLAWLLEKAKAAGFALGDPPQADVTRRDVHRFRRGEAGTGREVTLATVQFDGALTVTDPVRLRDGLINGIGPAKGYGCGMLTLAPVR